jgi:putative ABC transport system permease protein
MFKNYIKIAWRSLWRQKEYTLLNIVGLSIGLTCFITILLFVKQELSYDTFHSKANQIYRVVQHVSEDEKYAYTGGIVPGIMEKEFSNVERSVSFTRFATHISVADLQGQLSTFREEKFLCADTGFFEMFDLPLVKGTTTNALSDPFKVLLTESMAQKYFGDANPLGKELMLTGNFRFTVTGVLKDLPANSHIQFDFVTGMASYKATENIPVTARFGSFWWPMVWTYVQINSPDKANLINQQLPAAFAKHRSAEDANKYIPQLQPLKEIYLSGNYQSEMEPGGKWSTIYILLSVAVLTLLRLGQRASNLYTNFSWKPYYSI